MSDGPHRSLPMRRGWKRLAEYGDKPAFTPEEVCEAIVPALEQDCRAEVSPEFFDRLSDAFCQQQSPLFPDDIGPRLASLKDSATPGLERLFLDHALRVAESGGTGTDALQTAAVNALRDRGSRGLRQVEEHFLLKSTTTRARRVRERIEAALGLADLKGFVRRLFGLDPRPTSGSTVKRTGLDEGVRI